MLGHVAANGGGVGTTCAVSLTALLVGACGLAGCETLAEDGTVQAVQAPVVYGVDDRVQPDAYADATFAAQVRQSDVALMSASLLDQSNPSAIRLRAATTLAEQYDLCPGERFESEPLAAWCSGTLIGPDLVLTAGHCVTSQADCLGTSIVFGFEMSSSGELGTLTEDEVYSCRELASWRYEDVGIDFAVLRLDRDAVGHTPAPVRAERTPLPRDTEVVLVGHPSGLPVKIADGALVRDSRSNQLDYFVATTDSFEGNSGSGVFVKSTGELAGILVRGAPDYVDNGSCQVVNECPETGCPGAGPGEDVTYAVNAFEAYCDTGGAAPFCACGDGSCADGETSATCPLDCGAECGDGICNGDESAASCVADCGTCGDGECGSDESTASCCADCGCPGGSGLVCEDDFCNPDPDLGEDCPDAVELTPEGVVVVNGSTVSAASNANGSCSSTTFPDVPDRVYSFTLTEDTRVRAAAQGYDTLLYIRSICNQGSSEVVCNDDLDTDAGIYWAYVEQVLSPGAYYLFVDGYNAGGEYTLSVAFGDAANDTCAGAQVIPAEGLQRLRTSMIAADDDLTGSCGGNGGPDLVYRFELTDRTNVTAESFGVDTVLYVRRECDDAGSELACVNDSSPPGGLGSRVQLDNLEAGTYALIVDTADDSQLGALSLEVQFDRCPDDPDKLSPGDCGCGEPDVDADNDGVSDCLPPGTGGTGGAAGASGAGGSSGASGAGGSSGASGAGGSSGASGAGGTSGSGATPTGGVSGSGAASGDGGSSGSPDGGTGADAPEPPSGAAGAAGFEASDGGSDDDSGCGCSVPGTSRTPNGWWLLIGALGLTALRRLRARCR